MPSRPLCKSDYWLAGVLERSSVGKSSVRNNVAHQAFDSKKLYLQLGLSQGLGFQLGYSLEAIVQVSMVRD